MVLLLPWLAIVPLRFIIWIQIWNDSRTKIFIFLPRLYNKIQITILGIWPAARFVLKIHSRR